MRLPKQAVCILHTYEAFRVALPSKRRLTLFNACTRLTPRSGWLLNAAVLNAFCTSAQEASADEIPSSFRADTSVSWGNDEE